MVKNYILQNARLVDPANHLDEVKDLFITNGKIAETPALDAEKIDLSHYTIAPGFIDVHVHFRQPGGNAKETIETGTLAAAAGGFTTVLMMPNSTPKVDAPATVEWLKHAIEKDAQVKVLISGCMSKNSEGKEMAPIGALKKAGCVAITDDGKCVQNHKFMRNIVEYAKSFDMPVLDHCEDESMMAEGVMHEGYWSVLLGMKGIPSEAESLMVSRNIALAKRLNYPIHMQHISAQESVELMREALAKKIPVSCEVTPHHIALTDENIRKYDTNYKMNPPLRTEEDRQALIAALADNTISIIATDHAPHTSTDKGVEFDTAPFGIIGLETAFGICMTELVHKGHLSLSALIEKLTLNPAKLLKINAGTLTLGAPADLVVFDENETYTFELNHFKSRSKNSPFEGYEAKGKIKMTFVDGEKVYDAGACA